MVKVRTLRDMLLGSVAHPPGAEVEVLEDRAAELVARGHATFVDPPSRQLAGDVSARKAYLVAHGLIPPARPPSRVAAALSALRSKLGPLP